MTETRPLVIAIEGGGSKTVAIAVDAGGHVIAHGKAGSSLALYVGDERSLDAVDTALSAAAEQIDADRVTVIASAMVGKGYATDPRVSAEERFPHARHVQMSEPDAALVGATLSSTGAVILAGTGSFGWAIGEDGATGHCGGGGPLVGDEGSGHWIALEAMRRGMWARDGRGGETVLIEAIQEHYGLEHYGHIIGRLYGRDKMSRRDIASLAPVVCRAADAGDAVAILVLEMAADQLAHLVATAILKVKEKGDGWGDGPLLGCTGGVCLGSRMLREMIAARVAETVPDIVPCDPHLPPVGGVAIRALREAGVEVEGDVLAQLQRSLPAALGAATLGD